MPEESAVASPEEVIDPLTLFPPNIRMAVEGLMYLGQLTDTVQFCGHSFGIRTLRPQHRFAIAQVIQPYRNTIEEVGIYRNATVGIALTHVDGDHNFCPPIGPDLEDLVKARLNYVGHHETGWYPPTLEFLWTRHQLLELTAAKAIAELHSLSQRSQPTTSSPWLDSLTVPESSADETSADIPLFMTSS